MTRFECEICALQWDVNTHISATFFTVAEASHIDCDKWHHWVCGGEYFFSIMACVHETLSHRGMTECHLSEKHSETQTLEKVMKLALKLSQFSPSQLINTFLCQSWEKFMFKAPFLRKCHMCFTIEDNVEKKGRSDLTNANLQRWVNWFKKSPLILYPKGESYNLKSRVCFSFEAEARGPD